jgi:hypothetical protein
VKAVLRLILFILISFVYWAAGGTYIFVTMLPCGFGPGVECDDPNMATVWLAVIGVVLIYGAVCVFLRGRWIAK